MFQPWISRTVAAAVTGRDTRDFVGDRLEQPRLALHDLRQPVAIEVIAVHAGVHERGSVEPLREFAGDGRRLEVVDLGMECRARRRAGAAAMRRDQQNGGTALQQFQPGGRRCGDSAVSIMVDAIQAGRQPSPALAMLARPLLVREKHRKRAPAMFSLVR